MDYDPFAAIGIAPPAQAQAGQTAQATQAHVQAQTQPSPQVQQAQTQPTQGVQPQPTQTQPSQPQSQSASQPVPPAQPNPTGGSGSPFVDFFNQLADPERAQAERVADLVQNHPTAAKVVGAINLGSLLLPPLAIAGAEGLGLFGEGLGGSAVADGLAGSTVAGAGRLVASTAARQAMSEAEATLPNGITRKRLAGFEQGLPASSQASTEATADIISKLKEAGITSRSIAAFQRFMRVQRATIHPTCRRSTGQPFWQTS